MELLESVGPRPRQARYQAALRPDSNKFLFYWNLQLLSRGIRLFGVPEVCFLHLIRTIW